MSRLLFQGMSIGFDKDLRAVYSNGLEASQSAAVHAYLADMGFSVAALKKTTSLHVIDRAHDTSHVIVFNVGRCDTSIHLLLNRVQIFRHFTPNCIQEVKAKSRAFV